jgi:hypothetical protein
MNERSRYFYSYKSIRIYTTCTVLLMLFKENIYRSINITMLSRRLYISDHLAQSGKQRIRNLGITGSVLGRVIFSAWYEV